MVEVSDQVIQNDILNSWLVMTEDQRKQLTLGFMFLAAYNQSEEFSN